MDNDKIFGDGISFKPPRSGAPMYVIGSVSVSVEKFITFLNDYKNKEGWVNLDLKKSKGDKFYFELNTWKKGDAPKAAKPVQQKIDYPDTSEGEIVGYTKDYKEEDINPDDIPF